MTLFIILAFTIGFILGIFACVWVNAKTNDHNQIKADRFITMSSTGFTHRVYSETTKGLRLYPGPGTRWRSGNEHEFHTWEELAGDVEGPMGEYVLAKLEEEKIRKELNNE